MLINYNGQYTDVSTLAHELGHTMQSYYSTDAALSARRLPTFVAEVASTFNESLLIDYMLGQIKDDDTRLSLLGNYLENIKGTGVPPDAVRRIRAAHARDGGKKVSRLPATRSEAVPGDHQEYYGDAQGVCVVDRYIAHEWSYIPHFYRDFYVSSTDLVPPPPRRSRRR